MTTGVERRASARAYLMQAVVVPLWWLAMATSDRVAAFFAFPGLDPRALDAFVVPDLVLITGVSLWAWRRPGIVPRALVCGAFAYGALWCVATSVQTGGGYASTAAMALATAFNILLLLGDDLYRTSRVHSTGWNVARTLVQSAVIWVATLVVFPLAIVHAAGDWPPRIEPSAAITGGIAFAIFSAIGVWSGVTMAIVGVGTPLPLDGPRRLVISGPYAWIRNPMAATGLGQGASVAWILGSPAVLVYAAVGLLVWNFYVRPDEERYLEATFGDDFVRYRGAVRCWWPRWRPYRMT